jgi:hypothetical protein
MFVILGNNKLNGNIIMEMNSLAPIEVKILLCNEMEQKIETDSGIGS